MTGNKMYHNKNARFCMLHATNPGGTLIAGPAWRSSTRAGIQPWSWCTHRTAPKRGGRSKSWRWHKLGDVWCR